MDKLLNISALQLAKMIRAKKVSSEDVVQTYIAQAKRVNPFINAIVRDRYELAVLEAKDVDQRLKADPDTTSELLGVPCTIKEQLAVKGMPQTLGLVYMRHYIAEQDATIVSRLKAAGAIPIGVTNIPTLAMHWETDNKLYGRTNNPYDLERIPGGSSGGEAAMISSAGSAFGIGTDIGGSIRIPAFFCGIFGHKSSPGLVPRTGSQPIIPHIRIEDLKSDFKLRNFYGVAGPMTRFAEDLMPILKTISGPDGIDPYTEKMPLGDVGGVNMPALTFYYMDHQDLHPDVKIAQDAAINVLINSGAKVIKIDLDKFEHAFEIMIHSLSRSNNLDDMMLTIAGHRPFDLEVELELAKVGKSEFTDFILLSIKSRLRPQALLLHNYFEMGVSLREELAELLGNNGVLIYPTHPYPAIKHGEAIHLFSRMAFTGIFNILGCPSTAFPMGFSQEGLPVGMQAVAKNGNDHLTIAVAQFMENKGFGWIPPQLAK
jgi:fatty acid amide hydrolase 2